MQSGDRAGRLWLWWAAGFLTLPALFALAMAGGGALLPDWPLIGPAARMLDSVPFHLAAIGAVLGLCVAALGPRRLGAGLSVAACALAALVWVGHARTSLALAPHTPSAVRILWFNMLNTNTNPPETLIAAIRASGADLVVLSEVQPIIDHKTLLAAGFLHMQGCRDFIGCNLIVLSKRPGTEIQASPVAVDIHERLAVITLPLGQGASLSVVALHLIKPWFYGPAELNQWLTQQQIGQVKGPLVVLGDFNAAPWSRRGRAFLHGCGLRSQPWPVATWPTQAGSLGVPIDQVLTRGGAVVRGIEAWGEGLGSNHLGLLVEIGLSDPQPAPGVYPDCPGPPNPSWRLDHMPSVGQ